MPDRGKVIQGLKCCCGTGMCFHGCPYYDASKKITECTSQLALEALDLLKEQEAIVGRWISIPHKKARICSICHADEPYKFADDDADIYDFCPHCGAKMEGR